MSLVDYTSSSDGEDDEQTQNANSPPHSQNINQNQHEVRSFHASSSPRNSVILQHGEASEESYMEPAIKLPDAAELLGSLEGTTVHKDNVSYASSSQKRPAAYAPGSVMPHGKLLKGNLPASKIPPDTSGGQLIPPQLKGRSNVVTEDIEKLFVGKRKAEEDTPGCRVYSPDM